MTFTRARFFLAFFFSLFSLSLRAQNDNIDVEGLVRMGAQVYQEGNEKFLVVTFENQPEWHTYWKNPGDAGIPLQLEFFSAKNKIEVTALEWPAPKRFIADGDIWGFGYTDQYALFFSFPKQVKNYLVIKGKWLVCKDVCLSSQGEVQGKLSDDQWEFNPSHQWSEERLGQLKAALPVAAPWPASLQLKLGLRSEQKTFSLDYTLSGVGKISQSQSLLIPFPSKPFGFKHEKLAANGAQEIRGQIDVEWDGDYQEPPEPFPVSGTFSKAKTMRFLFTDPQSKKSVVLEKTFTQIAPYQAPAAPLIQEAAPVQDNFLYYLFFAFLGGLILNLMPCVLPMISLKLFELIKLRESSAKEVLKKNVAYCLGVIFSLFSLSLVVVWMKNLGAQASWGIQLQSPLFVGLMIVLLFIFALNLFGLFEFATPGGKFLGNFKLPRGFLGDFTGGILSTILSTPCSAPFLGTALTFAFTSSGPVIVAMFLAIALGLCSPFILVGLFPRLLKFLPRPGMWMEQLKKFLGLALVLTIVWLQDVFIAQTYLLQNSSTPHIQLSLTLIFCFFAFLLKKEMPRPKYLANLFFLLSFFFAVQTVMALQTKASVSSSEIPWQPWSVEKLQRLQAEKKLVFMDFTAKWCFNCKVNEKLVLHTQSFQQLAKEMDLTLLEADWTSYDPVIGDWLKARGIFGVPAYFLQLPSGEILNLGETVTLKKIRQALNK